MAKITKASDNPQRPEPPRKKAVKKTDDNEPHYTECIRCGSDLTPYQEFEHVKTSVPYCGICIDQMEYIDMNRLAGLILGTLSFEEITQGDD